MSRRHVTTNSYSFVPTYEFSALHNILFSLQLVVVVVSAAAALAAAAPAAAAPAPPALPPPILPFPHNHTKLVAFLCVCSNLKFTEFPRKNTTIQMN